MKSYLRFLSRNKLYTAIEVVGLSIALAFVIVLGSYVLEDLNCDKSIRNAEEVYVLRNMNGMEEFFVRHDMDEEMFSDIPGIKSMTQIIFEEDNLGGQTFMAEYLGNEHYFTSLLAVEDNFFDFFSFPLDSGNPVRNQPGHNGAIISKLLAEKIFGNENPIGKIIGIPFASFDEKNEFVVEGVFKDFPNTSLPVADVIISHESYKECASRIWGSRNDVTEDPMVEFIRTERGSDIESIKASLTNVLNSIAGRDEYYDIELVTLKDYHRKYGHGSRAYGRFRNTDIYNVYLNICMILAILSLLNYILLTVAYSHFRIKEMATRQLLGTDRRGVILRCTFEALFIIAVSMILAMLAAISCKDIFSSLLDTELHPMKTAGEYIIIIVTAVLMAIPAGIASSIAIAKYSPVDIIKGQNRRQEKSVISKLFIGLEGCIAIASTAMLITVTRQNAFILNYPMGYEKDNLIYLDFKTSGPRYLDQLKSLAFVEEAGAMNCLPMYRYRVMFPNGGGALGYIEAQRSAFDMIGIEINDYGETDFGPSGEAMYLSEETMDAIPGAITDREWFTDDWGSRKPIRGTCSHFRTGTLKTFYSEICAALVIADWRAEHNPDEHNYLVKVNGDEDTAAMKLQEMYKELGYDDKMISVKSLNQYLKDDIRKEKNLQNLLMTFVLACLLLTALAIAAFSGYYAQLRTHDTAVRKVFGESGKEVFRKTVWGFIAPVLISTVIAVPTAYFMASKWLEDYMVRVENSWFTYVAAVAFVLIAVFVSVVLQTIRLMRTNPAVVLKKE
ncbi:MAG: ABC transporter permease [Bacteroidales bacterium]|nr:ABC transporter permease [Bacteroidales bacterium]